MFPGSKILAVNQHTDEACRAQLVQRNCPLLPAEFQTSIKGLLVVSGLGKEPTVNAFNDNLW